ncbi:MAG: dephospho-CoA kinase [Bryobacteraceae bacterium]|jgi:dephospho-CoA kinase
MLLVGLTGGMACGKSFVAAALRELGCYVIEADELGHEVLRPDGEAYAEVVAAFGTGILDVQGLIDRPKLAAIAFGDPAQLERLNAIVHPAVRKRAQRQFREIADRDPHAVVIYVVAILIESGAWRGMDKIIVVSCDREQQIARAMHRPGAVESGVLARLENQMPLDKKRAFADYAIDTSGTKEDTLRQTAIVYEDLRRLAS